METEDRSTTPAAVIIANGRYPHHPIPLAAIEKATYIVCCDGAANKFIELGYIPNAIVGDCDSISEENKKKFAHLLYPDTEQESNDLAKAVRFCIRMGIFDIVIIGGTGMREDHTLGNISLLVEFPELQSVIMLTNNGEFMPVFQTTIIKSTPGQQISIFAIDPLPLSASGLKYPITNRIFTNWWQGTLNEATGTYFTIETEGRLIVFKAYERK